MTRSVLLTTLTATLLALVQHASAQDDAGWRLLTLKEGGRIEYPGSVFRPLGADNGLLAFGGPSGSFFTVALEALDFPGEPDDEQFEQIRRGWAFRGFDLTYRHRGPGDLVLSGAQWDGELIFYQRIRYGRDRRSALQFVVTYPRHLKPALDGAVTRMSRSFRFEGE